MKIKDELYIMKTNILIAKGIKKGLIKPFDNDYYQELNNTIVNTIPVDIDIKYLRPSFKPGKCYDRSLKMFYAMDNSLLVRGSLEYFRIQGDYEGHNHGWVERDNNVYDPTWLLIFDKDYYYKIFKVNNVTKINQEEYCNLSKKNNEEYQKAKTTTRDSFKYDGYDRFMLIATIPLLEGIANKNELFKKELNKYLKEINYNEKEINNAIKKEYNKTLTRIS